MKWSDMDKIQKISLVEKMAAEGLSASQIAQKFKGVSRNAVIGFAHRNKISLIGKRWPEGRVDPTPANDVAKPFPGETTDLDKPAKSVKAKPEKPRKPAKVTRIVRPAKKSKKSSDDFEALEFKPPAPPEPRPLNLLELNDSHCKWPLFFDAKTQPFGERLFCGCQVRDGRPYCVEHCRLAYDGVISTRAPGEGPNRPPRKRRPFRRWG